MSWIHLNFLRRSGAFHVGTARWSWLCALVAPSESIETWVWLSNQNSSGTVRPAYSGEFFARHDTRAKSSRPCSMVAVLFVREFICKPLSAVWVCELVPYYAPRRWRIKCASKSAWEKKYMSKTNQLQKTEIVLHKLSTETLAQNTRHQNKIDT